MNGRSGRHNAGLRRRIAMVTSAVLVGALLQAVAAPAVTADAGKDKAVPPAAGKSVAGYSAKVKPRKVMKGPRTPSAAPHVHWPKAATETITVPARSATGKAPSVEADKLPLSLRTASAINSDKRAAAVADAVTVRTMDRAKTSAAGVDGLLFTLQSGTESATSKSAAGGDASPTGAEGDAPASGQVTALGVTVDYSGFAESSGGGYGSRLRLYQLPSCAVTTPAEPQCRRATPVEASNDTEHQTLTADRVQLRGTGSTVLAAEADDDSSKTDYKATSLSPSATWSTDLNTGDFSWSYDMPVPSVPGGFTPKVSLDYSSSTIDGRTGNTNNQSSWVGDGFDLSPGFIERSYKPCADDGVTNADGNKPGDECWAYDNAFLTFNGKGGELVPAGKDAAGNAEWKLRKDDGTRVTRLADSDRGNGDNDGEYWLLTTPDGTRYYFGYNRLPGWADGKGTTDSTWTVPVYGDDSSEPCHADTFTDSWCRQAWRWNLDYAVDTHGNAIAYYYNKEDNSYGRNLKAADNTRYTRGGTLDRIEYGLRSDSVYGTEPLAKVEFDSSQRCLPDADSDCASISSDSAYWYDTPWDLNCEADSDCDGSRLSPSFWTRMRLTSVTTKVRTGAGTYATADSWKLTHQWGMSDTDYQLLLSSIEHTGESATPSITLPKTTFAYTAMANRLDKTGDGYAPFIKDRLTTVDDEYGGQIDVAYSDPACDWDTLPTPQTNTIRCYPQFIGGDSDDDPDQEWFNKYVVKSVTATDRTGGAPDAVTSYAYLDDAAWHFDDDDGLTKEKFKTWSQWRGYGHVQVETGGQGGDAAMRSQDDSYFLRGMDGDRKDTSGGTKSVSVTLGAGEGDPITDDASANGFKYKDISYSSPAGKVLAKSVNRPWHHQTAQKVHDWGTLTADFTGTAETKTWTSLDDGAGAQWRTASTSTTYDTVAGRATEVDDRGDTSTADDNRCTRTTYATNTTDNVLTLPARVETVAVACDATPDRTKDVISDVRTAYDGQAYGAAPTKWKSAQTATLKKHDGTTATYLESGTTFDTYGRTLTTTDLTADVTVTGDGDPVRVPRSDGRTTTQTYTPDSGYPTIVTDTTPPADPSDADSDQTTVTTLDPVRGQATQVSDPNGNNTKISYDALGRTSKVWLADRTTVSNLLPTYEYRYTVSENQPVSVETLTLSTGGSNQIPSYTFYDGLLRPRQTQARGPDGGLELTDTFYDERGLDTRDFATYYSTDATEGTLFAAENALSVETQTWHSYDGLGRETETKQVAGNGDGGTVLATTKTIYGGDRTTVIPPDGATATTTLVDARGQTTQLRQLHEHDPAAAYDTTTYTHTPQGRLHTVTDPAGNTWTYTYDQLGRQTIADDPDKGTTTSSYDDRGQLAGTTDERGTTLVHLYDGLGRKTELHQDTATGPLRAKWTYDTVTRGKGRLATATRYDGDNAYTFEVTSYDRLYRQVRTAVEIPAAEGALAGKYQEGTAYKSNGLVGGISYSAAGSLPGGSYNYTYDERTLWPSAVFGDGFANDIGYSTTGEPLQYKLGDTAQDENSTVTNTYEWGTQRLRNTRVDRQDVPGVDKSTTYTYDQAGNILSASDVSSSGTDNQCYTYDYLARLTQAWTQPDSTCSATPTASDIGGPAPYWQTYHYDSNTGNRTSETDHDFSGATGGDTQRTYEYPQPGSPQPHTLTSVTTTTPTLTSKDTYTYDADGNTQTRSLSGDDQTLTWDAEGHLTKVTEPATDGGADKVTEYLYDADGNRLIARTPTATTLYLSTGEVTLPKGSTTPRATRYIPLGSGDEAVQQDDGTFTFTIADHQGTGQLAISSNSQTMTQRRTLPFGGDRGTQPAPWPGTKGFVGGTDDTDTTGLTHLGAREYDPATGRFISVDPLLDTTDPQQMNGYAYADNNPVTTSDPDGQERRCPSTMSVCGSSTDTGGDGPASIATPVHHSSGYGSGGAGVNIGQDSGGQTTIEGVRIPQYKELSLYAAAYGKEDTYSYRVHQWAAAKCSAGTVSNLADFCSTATELGLVSNKSGNDPFGIKASIHCITGRGDCAEAVVQDVLTLVGGGLELGALRGATAELEVEESALGARGLNPCTNCFLAGTRVLMADGATKTIENIKAGDEILATDPKTGKTRPRTVTRLIVTHGDKYFNELSIATDHGVEKLTATHEHPFWSPSEHRWVTAGTLKPGMTLRTPHGQTAIVTHNRAYTAHATTYNLTVDDLHTYYVLAGETPVLVHNSNCPTTPVGGRGTNFRNLSPNEPATIGGRDYAGHAIDRMQERGLMPSVVENTIRVGERMPGKRAGTTAYYEAENHVTVITDTATGRVVTVSSGRIKQ